MVSSIKNLDKIVKSKLKVPSYKSRHFRWNCVESPESSIDLPLVRYFFDVVDDKGRNAKIERIIETVQNKTIMVFPFEKICSYSGTVKGTGLNYLCEVYDSPYSQKLVGSSIKEIFGNKAVRDINLYDRVKKGTSLDLYLLKLHSGS